MESYYETVYKKNHKLSILYKEKGQPFTTIQMNDIVMGSRNCRMISLSSIDLFTQFVTFAFQFL